MTYRVYGEAHGSSFDERGFTSEDEATRYASSIIDGDWEATIEVASIVEQDGSIGAERLG
jgi:hypothetical protein